MRAQHCSRLSSDWSHIRRRKVWHRNGSAPVKLQLFAFIRIGCIFGSVNISLSSAVTVMQIFANGKKCCTSYKRALTSHGRRRLRCFVSCQSDNQGLALCQQHSANSLSLSFASPYFSLILFSFQFSLGTKGRGG